MLKAIKQLLERNAYLIAFLLTAIILYLSLTSVPNSVSIGNKDKVLHSLAYFCLALSWLFAVKQSHQNIFLKLMIILSVIIYGIVIEVLQERLTSNRMMDIYDALANSFGALLALLVFGFLLKQLKSI